MRLSTSSSVILATLASSVSFGQLAAAAPTDDTANSVGLRVPDFGSLNPVGEGTVRRSAGAHQRREIQPFLDNAKHGLDGLQSLEAKRNLEARQLGAVTDTVAGLLPGVVDKILGLLGLQRTSAIDTAEALPEGVAKQLEALVGQATSATSGLPLAGGVVGSASGLVGSVTGRQDSGTSAPPPSPSSPAPAPPAAPALPGLPSLPVSLPTGALPSLPAQAPQPPVQPPVQLPDNSVIGALPVPLPLLSGPPSNATA